MMSSPWLWALEVFDNGSSERISQGEDPVPALDR